MHVKPPTSLLQPELVHIMRGEVDSILHRIFESGTSKDKRKLKLLENRGPIMKWRDSMVRGSLVHKLLRLGLSPSGQV